MFDRTDLEVVTLVKYTYIYILYLTWLGLASKFKKVISLSKTIIKLFQ